MTCARSGEAYEGSSVHPLNIRKLGRVQRSATASWIIEPKARGIGWGFMWGHR